MSTKRRALASISLSALLLVGVASADVRAQTAPISAETSSTL